jgi:hypothetical protein
MRTFLYGARELGSFLTEYMDEGNIVFAIPTKNTSQDFFNTVSRISCRINDKATDIELEPNPVAARYAARHVRIQLFADAALLEKVFDSSEDQYPQNSTDIDVSAYGTPYLWCRAILTKISDGTTPTLKSVTVEYTHDN